VPEDQRIVLADSSIGVQVEQAGKGLAGVGRRRRPRRLVEEVITHAVRERISSADQIRYVLERVEAEVGLERDALVMVGDDFEGDVVSANRCGIRAVWFNEGDGAVKTGDVHWTIQDLRELPGAFEMLLR
jgi:hypothetical protein